MLLFKTVYDAGANADDINKNIVPLYCVLVDKDDQLARRFDRVQIMVFFNIYDGRAFSK